MVLKSSGWAVQLVGRTTTCCTTPTAPGGHHGQLVGRYADTLHRKGDRWRIHRRVATFST